MLFICWENGVLHLRSFPFTVVPVVANLAQLLASKGFLWQPFLFVINVRLSVREQVTHVFGHLKSQFFFELAFKYKTLQTILGAMYSYTPRLKRSTYSLNVSFLSWTMAFNSAMVFSRLRLAIKWDVNSLHSSPHELIELSCRPMNQVTEAPFKVKTNNLHFTAPLPR